MYRMDLSVIIPSKNDRTHIEGTIRSVFNYLQKREVKHEIIVVTNKSTDGTVDIVKKLMPDIPSLKLLDYPHQGGKGFAVREGMLRATGDYRLFMDADNSTTIDHLERMMPYFAEGYDVVIGSIRVAGHRVAAGSESGFRILLGRLSGLYSRIVLLPGIYDTQRGFKIMTARAAEKIWPLMRITQFGFDMELLALARKFGFKIKEAPVNWKNDDANSHVKPSAYIQVLLDTLRIKWWLMTGVYSHATMTAAPETK
jgi:glycosyltransferase involved in cell wall biosynthesis